MKNNNDPKTIQDAVRNYYSEIVQASGTDANTGCSCFPGEINCCQTDHDIPIIIGVENYLKIERDGLLNEIAEISLGCGDPVTLATLKPGQTVLDLGSGGGLDCFIAASKVGLEGKVIGVDMTAEMVSTAQENQARLGLSNIDFRQGEIESLPVDDNSIDVIISNCVINLSTNKPKVFQEAFRVLKPGGKFAVSDIVIDGDLDPNEQSSLSAWVSCLAGALGVDEFRRLLEAAGFVDVLVQTKHEEPESPNPAAGETIMDETRSEIEKEQQPPFFSAKITAWKPIGDKAPL